MSWKSETMALPIAACFSVSVPPSVWSRAWRTKMLAMAEQTTPMLTKLDLLDGLCYGRALDVEGRKRGAGAEGWERARDGAKRGVFMEIPIFA